MRLTMTILVLAVLAGAPARADDDCFVAMTDWQPRKVVVQLAQDRGWTVRRIRIDDGCYEIHGWDAQGRRIEVKVHPASLRILELEYEDDDHGDDDDHRRDRDEGRDRDRKD